MGRSIPRSKRRRRASARHGRSPARFQMRIGADDGAVVSEDGTTLLVYDMPRAAGGPASATAPYRFRFYDLCSLRPWFWAVAIPTALFAVYWLWGHWRCRRT